MILTVPTADGLIDLVAIARTAGGDEQVAASLTEPERLLAAHLLTESGASTHRVATLLHTRSDKVKELLTKPRPTDKRGRTITL